MTRRWQFRGVASTDKKSVERGKSSTAPFEHPLRVSVVTRTKSRSHQTRGMAPGDLWATTSADKRGFGLRVGGVEREGDFLRQQVEASCETVVGVVRCETPIELFGQAARRRPARVARYRQAGRHASRHAGTHAPNDHGEARAFKAGLGFGNTCPPYPNPWGRNVPVPPCRRTTTTINRGGATDWPRGEARGESAP